MKNSRLVLVSTLLAVGAVSTLTGCATRPPAPIVHRAPSTGTAEAKQEFYTVSRADTLSQIAQRFGVTVRDLQEWNGLGNSTVLQAGQVLRVAPPTATAGVRGTGGTSATVTPAPAAPAPVAETAPVRPPVVVAASIPTETRPAPKTGPKGLKRPYSDEVYAAMSRAGEAKPETTSGGPVVPAVLTPAPAPAAPAPAAASAQPASPIAAETRKDSTGIEWSWPAAGKVMQKYDGSRSRGLTLTGDPGKPVLAAAKGKVIFAGDFQDYGKLVIISHSPDLVSVYAQNNAIAVKQGQQVERGQRIADQGPRVQFEVRRQAKAVDPAEYLPSR